MYVMTYEANYELNRYRKSFFGGSRPKLERSFDKEALYQKFHPRSRSQIVGLLANHNGHKYSHPPPADLASELAARTDHRDKGIRPLAPSVAVGNLFEDARLLGKGIAANLNIHRKIRAHVKGWINVD